jgi:hypothetical protein
MLIVEHEREYLRLFSARRITAKSIKYLYFNMTKTVVIICEIEEWQDF